MDGIRTGENNPIVFIRPVCRLAQRPRISRGRDPDHWNQNHLCPEFPQRLGQFLGLMRRARHHNSYTLEPHLLDLAEDLRRTAREQIFRYSIAKVGRVLARSLGDGSQMAPSVR